MDIIAGFFLFGEGALAARVFVGAKGSSSLPPRAQRYIWAGQIGALAGSDANVSIGLWRINLRGFVSLFCRKPGSCP